MPQGLLDTLNIRPLTEKLPDKITLPGGEVKVDLQHVDKTASQVLGSATDLVLQISVALAIVLFGWVISSWFAGFTQRALIRARMEETVAAFLASFARYMLFLCCVIAACYVLGISFGNAVAVFGAIGLAVAFALRNTLTHLAAGLMLIINRPFKVGDYIELDQVAGTVKRVTLFNTEINTVLNQRLFIPNSRLWDSALRNHSYNEVRAIELKISFSNDDDPRYCKQVLKGVLEAHSLILGKPEPYLETNALDDSGIVYLIRFWVRTRDLGTVRSSIYDDIWHAAAKAGLALPYPQRVLHTAKARTPLRAKNKAMKAASTPAPAKKTSPRIRRRARA